ncbi:hypothetical protein H0H81_007225 [Sphagnurus paluster]|uniref:Proline dehydrogenase n=1 Tax=Sphagnurus paluster TaxID=117069 RepID=A0A9P7GJM4_9AGAR|nr:hypothetical protein H0H81_007225 [Sphagnurus paluster]
MLRACLGPAALARTCLRTRTSSLLHHQHRPRWHSTTSPSASERKPRLLLGLVGGTAVLATSIIYADSVNADPAADSLPALFRAYAVYSMCSIPAIVDNAPALLRLADLPIPGARWLIQSLVRVTFFDQFVGGDTAQDALPVIARLRAGNKGTLLVYSVEVDEAEAMAGASSSTSPHERIVDEIVRCVDAAADFEDSLEAEVRTTSVAVKLSALIPDAHILVKLSKYLLTTRPPTPTPVPFPGSPHDSDLDILSSPIPPTPDLTPTDLAALRILHMALRRICAHAAARRVRVIFDAEYSWYQPAIDALTHALSREFNAAGQPLVYATYQAYLRRTPAQLAQALADAQAGGYALGIKLVRGAYHPYEVSAHAVASDSTTAAHRSSTSISPDPLPPVWLTKNDTDACYDDCARMVLRAVADDLRCQVVDPRSSRPGPTAAAPPYWTSWWSSSPASPEEKGTQDKAAAPSVAVLFGTHNWASCCLVLDELVRTGLARSDTDKVYIPDAVTSRVAVGQLYGMCDDLTDDLAQRTVCSAPFVVKYLPYGALGEVMPYLSRRALENRSVLGEGGAARERARAGREIWARVRGMLRLDR